MSICKYLGLGLVGILLARDGRTGSLYFDLARAGQQGTAPAESQAIKPFSANDVLISPPRFLAPAATTADLPTRLVITVLPI